MVTVRKYAVIRQPSYCRIAIFPVVELPWMRNNLIKNVLIQFPCPSHTSFNMYRNSKCLNSWAIKLANSQFLEAFLCCHRRHLFGDASKWHLTMRPVSWEEWRCFISYWLIISRTHGWTRKEPRAATFRVDSYLELSAHWYFHWDSGRWLHSTFLGPWSNRWHQEACFWYTRTYSSCLEKISSFSQG
jgi:hypothetical protein